MVVARSRRPVSAELLENLGHVACGVQHSHDSQRIAGRVVHDQVGIDALELQRTIGQILTRVSNAPPRRQQDERLLEREHDLYCRIDAVAGNEVSDSFDVRLGALR
jgi:hypothetical protein